MLKIGELAKQTGVSVGTLRYYESLGLIEPSQRSESGYRYYADATVHKVQFIKKAGDAIKGRILKIGGFGGGAPT
jgi:DNA-binding transcriptional MerR regulator